MMETEFRLTVNGAERSVACEPDTPLLEVLRHDLGLAGPKFGCGMGHAGRVSRSSGTASARRATCRRRPWTARSSRWRGCRVGNGLIRSSRLSSTNRPPSAATAPPAW